MPIHNIIYDDVDFALWKREVQLELQEIYDRTSDQFIRDILSFLGTHGLSWFVRNSKVSCIDGIVQYLADIGSIPVESVKNFL